MRNWATAPSGRATCSKSPSRRKLSFATITVGDIGILLGFNALFFESYLQVSVASAFSYIDELCAIVLILAAIKVSLSKGVVACEKTGVMPIVATVTLFLLLGFLGTAVSRYQLGLYPIVIDFATSGKGLFCLAAALYLAQAKTFGDGSFTRLVVFECKILAVVLFVSAIVNLFVDVGFGAKARYGFRSFDFVFYHPTVVVQLVVGLSAILMASEKRPMKWALMLVFVLALTFRSKGFGAAAVVFLLAFFLTFGGKGVKIRFWHVAVVAFAVIVFGWSQLNTYYLDCVSYETARETLTSTSIELANAHFPFGTGYATFGSAVTAGIEYYSPLYYAYGFDTFYGLTPTHSSYISDSFWPTVIGQFGYLGLIAMIAAIAFVYVNGYRFAKSLGSNAVMAFLVIAIYFLIGSTSESAFFNPYAVYLSVCLCLAFSAARNRLDDDSAAEDDFHMNSRASSMTGRSANRIAKA